MLDEQDKVLLLKLAENLTGGNQEGSSRRDSLITNVQRRMRELGIASLFDYLHVVEKDPQELAVLISSLTIHTTSWFRENPHFVAFQEMLLASLKKNETFNVWCSACSTGEEVYSFALVLEEFRKINPKFEYRLLGSDIDPVSIATAQRAVYSSRNMNFHLSRYKHHLMMGSGATQDFFTLSKEIRSRCIFRVTDLRVAKNQPEGPFNVVVCRNVLIYFNPETVDLIVANLLLSVKTDGHLFLGHSESINATKFHVFQLGHSIFNKPRAGRAIGDPVVPGVDGAPKIQVLSIDDSATSRKLLNQHFTDMGFQSTTVSSGAEASKFLKANVVDLITLDLKMPEMNGDSWLEAQRKAGLTTPVVIVSDVHTGDANAVVQLLGRGAQEYMEKDKLFNKRSRLKETFLELVRGNTAKPKRNAVTRSLFPAQRPQLILIGASTGGPQALMKLLASLPDSTPPVVVTQHISQKFTAPLAERLCAISHLKPGRVENGAPVIPGHLYVACDDLHIGVIEKDDQLIIQTSDVPAINGHRPSVDAMFNSIKNGQFQTMALLLTGMGRDGANGMRAMRNRGAFCIAQSEEDCVVYGMPREAIALDAADFVGTIEEIRKVVLDSLHLKVKKSA